MDKVIATAKKFRELDIPVDHFAHLIPISIWHGRDRGTTEERLAMTRRLSDELAKLNIKVGLYVGPFMNSDSEMGMEAKEKGYVLTRKDGSPYEKHQGWKLGYRLSCHPQLESCYHSY